MFVQSPITFEYIWKTTGRTDIEVRAILCALILFIFTEQHNKIQTHRNVYTEFLAKVNVNNLQQINIILDSHLNNNFLDTDHYHTVLCEFICCIFIFAICKIYTIYIHLCHSYHSVPKNTNKFGDLINDFQFSIFWFRHFFCILTMYINMYALTHTHTVECLSLFVWSDENLRGIYEQLPMSSLISCVTYGWHRHL